MPNGNPNPGLRAKSRIVVLAQTLRREATNPTCARWEGGFTPTTRNLLRTEILDVITNRGSIIAGSSAAFISTKYGLKGDHSLPAVQTPNGELDRARPVMILPLNIERKARYVKLRKSINGFSSGPLTWDFRSTARLRSAGYRQCLRDPCFFCLPDEWSDVNGERCEIGITEAQQEAGVGESEPIRKPFWKAGYGGRDLSSPNKSRSIVRKHVDDFRESASYTTGEKEKPETIGLAEDSNFQLVKKLQPLLNLKLRDSITATDELSNQWRCALHLGMEMFVNHPHCNRLFFSQNRYLAGLMGNVGKSSARETNTPITKSFEGEYRMAIDDIFNGSKQTSEDCGRKGWSAREMGESVRRKER